MDRRDRQETSENQDQKRQKKVRRAKFMPLIVLLSILSLIYFVVNMQRAKIIEEIEERRLTLNFLNEEYRNKAKSLGELDKILAQSGSDDFIKTEARTKYGYISPGEIRFVVSNIEVLFDGGVVPEEILKRR